MRNALRSDGVYLLVSWIDVNGLCVIDYVVAQDGTKRGGKMPPKSKRVLPGKRYPLNMRTTKELRDKIEEAASTSGRSLVQEVEFRLEESFWQQEIEKETDTVGLKVRLSERLRRRLEQA